MDISAVPPPVQIKLSEPTALKVDVRPPDVQNGAPADGTRTKPTVLAALPPGQGTRIDQLA